MNDEERDARWQSILEARAEIADDPVSLESARQRRARRGGSSKPVLFDEALSGLGSWSSVEHTSRRLSA